MARLKLWQTEDSRSEHSECFDFFKTTFTYIEFYKLNSMQKQSKRHINILAFTLLRSINSFGNFHCQLLQLESPFRTV